MLEIFFFIRKLFHDIWETIGSFLVGLHRRLWPPSPTEAASSSPAPRPIAEADTDDHADEIALARMLASVDPKPEVQAVTGWIAVQKAKAKGKPLYNFLTKGQGYGPQDRRAEGKGLMFASTVKSPTRADLTMARMILSGKLVPSAAIRQVVPGGWIQRGSSTSDEEILNNQDLWKEGIYAQIAGTNWVLYSPEVRRMRPHNGETAVAVLNRIPTIPALDAPLGTLEQQAA